MLFRKINEHKNALVASLMKTHYTKHEKCKTYIVPVERVNLWWVFVKLKRRRKGYFTDRRDSIQSIWSKNMQQQIH